MSRAAALCLFALAATAQFRRTVPADLPEDLRHLRLDDIRAASLRRSAQGEQDHMIFYALQSGRFTHLPRIEPAASARAFVESKAIPPEVVARLKAFLAGKPTDPRHAYFRTHVSTEEEMERSYAQAMEFLYEKEWASRPLQGAARRGFIAGLYQSRAHSTDSDAAASYAVWAALRNLPQTSIRRVLVVGPGMDIAPRMALDDEDPPQSLQPYLIADTILRLGLARAGELEVHCADINPRVVRYLRTFPEGTRRLRVKVRRGDDDWNAFFDTAGSNIGKRLEGGWIEVARTAAARVTAFEADVLTGRPDTPRYDVIVATNVLVYFNHEELRLAFSNLAAGLVRGGSFVHNDTRAEVEPLGGAAGLPVTAARMVRLAAPAGREFYDAAVLHTRR